MAYYYHDVAFESVFNDQTRYRYVVQELDKTNDRINTRVNISHSISKGWAKLRPRGLTALHSALVMAYDCTSDVAGRDRCIHPGALAEFMLTEGTLSNILDELVADPPASDSDASDTY